METFAGPRVPNWEWGTERQLFACRLFQAFGLVAVLGLLLALGWTP
jgi:hypothetical protein